jgi:hypothetical protein
VAAKDHGAASFGSAVLRLASQVKEHYLGFVSETFPDLLPRYERAYAGTNIAPTTRRRSSGASPGFASGMDSLRMPCGARG